MNVNWYSGSICYLFKTPEFNLLLLKLWGAICYTPQTISTATKLVSMLFVLVPWWGLVWFY